MGHPCKVSRCFVFVKILHVACAIEEKEEAVTSPQVHGQSTGVAGEGTRARSGRNRGTTNGVDVDNVTAHALARSPGA
jgi:hypothetical protein